VIKCRQFLELLFPECPAQFLFRELDQFIQTPDVTLLQERVQQHRAERWAQRKRQSDFQAVLLPLFEQLKQRDVALGNGFELPAFF